jgi:hypothetical protein
MLFRVHVKSMLCGNGGLDGGVFIMIADTPPVISLM